MNETKKNIKYTLPASFYYKENDDLLFVYLDKELRRTHRQLMGGNNGIHRAMEVVVE